MMFDLPWVPTSWMPRDIGWHYVRDYSNLDRFGLDDAANDKTTTQQMVGWMAVLRQGTLLCHRYVAMGVARLGLRQRL